MKSMCKIAALVALLSITGVSTALATNTVTITNNTSYTLTEFYASSTDASAWDTTNNLMAGKTLAPGAQTTITLGTGGGEDACQFDLMAVLLGTTQHAYTYSVVACGGGSWAISGM